MMGTPQKVPLILGSPQITSEVFNEVSRTELVAEYVLDLAGPSSGCHSLKAGPHKAVFPWFMDSRYPLG